MTIKEKGKENERGSWWNQALWDNDTANYTFLSGYSQYFDIIFINYKKLYSNLNNNNKQY